MDGRYCYSLTEFHEGGRLRYILQRQILDPLLSTATGKPEKTFVDADFADEVRFAFQPLWHNPFLRDANDHLDMDGANFYLEMQFSGKRPRTVECFAGTFAASICRSVVTLINSRFPAPVAAH